VETCVCCATCKSHKDRRADATHTTANGTAGNSSPLSQDGRLPCTRDVHTVAFTLGPDQVKPRCNPPDVVQGQPTPMPSQTGLPPRTHPNGRRFWYLEMASSKIVIGKIFPTVLLRGQIIFVLVFTSSISIVQDQKHRQISMQKSTRVFRLRPPTRTRNRRVKHAKSDLRPNEWWQSAVQ
jgi:hypothetical protein